MADDEPRTGELTTANYGWIKPTVGDSDDAWGGYLNSDLDGIDSVVHGIQTSIPTVPAASATAPAMDGTASAGSSAAWSRGDHVHPSDTTKYNTSNPSGYQTAAQVTASLSSYLALSGGTMTGAMTLAADPAANLQPATKQYVDAARVGDNRIINGDMRIDQRNNGAFVTVNGYSIDRWAIAMSQAAKFNAQRTGSAAMTQNGFPYVLTFTSLSAYTPVTADSFFVSQTIEADMTSDFAWGTTGAQPVTLSFWVNVSAAGTYSGAITNNPTPPTRCYPFSFALPTGWTKVVITIPGDTAGTWVTSGNAGGVALRFDFGSGSQFRAAAGAWVNGNFNGVTGSTGIVATNGAVMQITGVKLEIGSVATPYNRQSLAKSMADCQRYYQTSKANARFPASGVNQFNSNTISFSPMRASPTSILGSADNTVNITAATSLAVNSNSISSATFSIQSAAAGDSYVLGCLYTLSAEL